MSTYRLRCVVLEDEDDIRRWLVNKLQDFPELEIVGEATTIDEAFLLIATTKPDAAFMDIQLIGGDAFTLLSRLQSQGFPIPYIVMATGYPEYVMTALNDYRRFVVQYLLKPFVENWRDKFRKAIDALMAAKMSDIQSSTAAFIPTPRQPEQHVFIQNKGSLLRFDFDKITYLEAAGGGEVIVVTDEGHRQVDLTLNRFMEMLPGTDFFRISKINIVNLKRVVQLVKEDHTVELLCRPKNKFLGVGDNFYAELKSRLQLTNDQGAKKQAAAMLRSRELAQRIELATVLVVEKANDTEQNSSCFRVFDDIIARYGMIKLHLLDNSYRCVGGLPQPDDANPQRVVQAAIDIQRQIAKWQAEQVKLTFEARIGIHSGPVMAKIDADDSTRCEAWGDTVLLASRIAHQGEAGQVYLSACTWKFVRREVNCRFGGTLHISDQEAMEIYIVGE